MIEKGSAELMQAGEGELHLSLDAGESDDPEVRRLIRDVLEQRGLADARLTVHHQRPTPAIPYGVQQTVECVDHILATNQLGVASMPFGGPGPTHDETS